MTMLQVSALATREGDIVRTNVITLGRSADFTWMASGVVNGKP